MVPYTIKNLLPIKDILKTIPFSGINNYIKILQRQRSTKTVVKELSKIELDKIVLKKVPPVLYLHTITSKLFSLAYFTQKMQRKG